MGVAYDLLCGPCAVYADFQSVPPQLPVMHHWRSPPFVISTYLYNPFVLLFIAPFLHNITNEKADFIHPLKKFFIFYILS